MTGRTELKTEYHMTDTRRLTMTVRREVVDKVLQLMREVQETSPVDGSGVHGNFAKTH